MFDPDRLPELKSLIRDPSDRRHVYDAQRLWPADPAAVRYQ